MYHKESLFKKGVSKILKKFYKIFIKLIFSKAFNNKGFVWHISCLIF